MTPPLILPASLRHDRIEARRQLLDAVFRVAERSGATALHLHGSLGRGTADSLSDIDVLVTFPDDICGDAIADRTRLYQAAGSVLLLHEAAPNRPIDGMYTLALYESSAGAMMVDWSLAPQRTSRVPPGTAGVFEHIPVIRGAWLLDHEARQEVSLAERVSWLVCMLFISIKFVVRGGDSPFIGSLGQAYRNVGWSYQFTGMRVTEPTSLTNISTMLRQLEPFADEQQRRAITAVDAFASKVEEMTGRDDVRGVP